MTLKNTKIKDRRNKMRLIDADKLKQHYAWWNDEIKELFDTIVDLQPNYCCECGQAIDWSAEK